MGYKDNLSEIIEEISLARSINHPTLDIEINFDATTEIVASTVRYMQSKRINVLPTNERTIESVIKLQAKAKVVLARRRTDKSPGNETFVERTIKHFQVTTKAIAVYLNQIGLFDDSGQSIVPKFRVQPTPGFIPVTPTVYGPDQRRMGIAVPADQNERQRVQGLLVENALPITQIGMNPLIQEPNENINIEELNRLYADIVNRIRGKCADAIVRIDFDEPLGGPAQLVGSREIDHETGRYVEAWSIRKTTRSALILGGACGFGRNSSDPLHNEAIKFENIDIDPSSWWDKLQRVNDNSSFQD